MQLALWMLCAFVPDAGRLGADDWREREAETRRCQNPISAALLPARSEDAEIDLRVKTVRADQLKYLNPVRTEWIVFRADFDRWELLYMHTGRSAIMHECPAFLMYFNSTRKGDLLLRYPCTNDPDISFLRCPPAETDYQRWRNYIKSHFPNAKDK